MGGRVGGGGGVEESKHGEEVTAPEAWDHATPGREEDRQRKRIRGGGIWNNRTVIHDKRSLEDSNYPSTSWCHRPPTYGLY